MCKWLLDASITNILGNIVKKNKCRKYINSFVLGIASISFLGLMVHVTCDSKEHEFAQIMKDENILIEGENGNLTLKQLEGLLDEINIENAYIKKKYEKKIYNSNKFVEMEPEDIMEIHYYGMSKEAQNIFVERASNQVIQVEIGTNGTILISYNPNF